MTKRKNTCKERISTLHENLVVSFDSGDCLGNVGEIFIDKQTFRIKGISLTSKLIEPGEKDFVSFKDILKLGNSVIIVSSKAALENTPKGSESSTLRSLNGIKVVTQEGEHLGEMADANVIAESGVVQDVLMHGDKKIGVEVEKDQICIGPDMIVVPAAYKAKIASNPPLEVEEDCFGNVVKSAGEMTRKLADSFNSAFQKMAGLTMPEDNAEGDKGKQDARPGADSKKGTDAVGKSTATASSESPKKTATKKAEPAAKKAATKKKVAAKKKVSGAKSDSAKPS